MPVPRPGDLTAKGVARPAVETVADDLAAEQLHDWLDEKPAPPMPTPGARRKGSAAS